MPDDTFAARLRSRRLSAGLSLRALAAAARLSHQAVHRFESGKAEPVFSTACRLAAALRCTLDALRPR